MDQLFVTRGCAPLYYSVLILIEVSCKCFYQQARCNSVSAFTLCVIWNLLECTLKSLLAFHTGLVFYPGIIQNQHQLINSHAQPFKTQYSTSAPENCSSVMFAQLFLSISIFFLCLFMYICNLCTFAKLHVYGQLPRSLRLPPLNKTGSCTTLGEEIMYRSTCRATVVLNIGIALKSLFKKIFVLLICHYIDVSVRNI